MIRCLAIAAACALLVGSAEAKGVHSGSNQVTPGRADSEAARSSATKIAKQQWHANQGSFSRHAFHAAQQAYIRIDRIDGVAVWRTPRGGLAAYRIKTPAQHRLSFPHIYGEHYPWPPSDPPDVLSARVYSDAFGSLPSFRLGAETSNDVRLSSTGSPAGQSMRERIYGPLAVNEIRPFYPRYGSTGGRLQIVSYLPQDEIQFRRVFGRSATAADLQSSRSANAALRALPARTSTNLGNTAASEGSIVVFVAHNDNGRMVAPDGRRISLVETAERCRAQSILCIFLVCKSQSLVAHGGAGMKRNISMQTATALARRISVLVQTASESSQGIDDPVALNVAVLQSLAAADAQFSVIGRFNVYTWSNFLWRHQVSWISVAMIIVQSDCSGDEEACKLPVSWGPDPYPP